MNILRNPRHSRNEFGRTRKTRALLRVQLNFVPLCRLQVHRWGQRFTIIHFDMGLPMGERSRTPKLCITLISTASTSSPCNWRRLFKNLRTLLLVTVALPIFSACMPASVSSPKRLVAADEEVAGVRAYLQEKSDIYRTYYGMTDIQQKNYRNDVIATRMYAVDIDYTEYEANLTKEGQLTQFGADVLVQGLNTAAPLVSAAATAKILAGVAGGINGVEAAYVDKIWRAQLIENLQAMMRTARNDQAAIIFANMQCSASQYPLGVALSDLETYYRAGTLPSGMLKLRQTVSKAESDAQANQQTKKPAKNTDGAAKIEGNAKEAEAKKAQVLAKTSGCEGGPLLAGNFPQRFGSRAKNPVANTKSSDSILPETAQGPLEPPSVAN